MPPTGVRSPLNPPGTTELFLAFVNTRADGGGRSERFDDGPALREWLTEMSLDGTTTTVTDADAAAARELRDALVTMMLAHSDGQEVSADAVHEAESLLQRAGERYPLVTRVSADRVELTSEQRGVASVFGTVLGAVTEAALAGHWNRIKACRNPPCHFGFFDRTRNSSAAHCSTACSTQVSMRAYRQRKKNA